MASAAICSPSCTEAKTNTVYGLNASGWAPKVADHRNFLLSKGQQWMPSSGIHSVTVPGAVAGWDALLSRLGKKSFAEVLAPTIAYAKAGFRSPRFSATIVDRDRRYLGRNREGRPVYLPDFSAPPAVGRDIP